VAKEFQGPTVKRSAINLRAGIIIDEAFEKTITSLFNDIVIPITSSLCCHEKFAIV
jgi:large-conductance mechanosensitive channel